MFLRLVLIGLGVLLLSGQTFGEVTHRRSLPVSLLSERPENKGVRAFRDDKDASEQLLCNLKTSGLTREVSFIANNSASTVTPSFSWVKMSLMFTLWYGFNAGYNVYNAYMKKDFPFPLATALVQLFVGLFYAFPLWGLNLRKIPSITVADLLKLLPIAVLNAAGHACGVSAMFQKGGGSFTHVIKASEPVVSVLLGFVVNGIVPKPLTALSLLPITYGVAYASTLGNINPASMSKELNTPVAKLAMASNFAFAMRSIQRKNLPADFQGRTNLDPANEHAVTTLLSFLLLLPVVLLREGVPDMVSSLTALGDNKWAFAASTVLCGLCYYLYNEMQNVVLGSLGPVPTAVGNTLKRVVIFVALFLFTTGETFPLPKVVGCAIAIAGCLSFAVCDSKKV